MATQAFLGIHSGDGLSWSLAECENGRSRLHRRFRNSREELRAMAEYIAQAFARPRIYIAAAGIQSLALLKHLSALADAEVVFLSEVGYRQLRARWSGHGARARRGTPAPAALLAYYAESMV
ncbi:MAG: hypothetical protein FIA97_12565 [Methylococcaceae bacterium]|nr:hypothetical protein [Methylococcaceae bacterium]